jgi:excisionase family DNA binding protein
MEALLVTPAEAAKSLGISRSTLYELVAAQVIPSVKIGASRRLRTADLRAYVATLS